MQISWHSIQAPVPFIFQKTRFLTNLQEELLQEETRIRETLIDIQSMILPHMDTMQKRIDHARTLVKDINMSIANHMLELSAELQIDLHILKVIQDS